MKFIRRPTWGGGSGACNRHEFDSACQNSLVLLIRKCFQQGFDRTNTNRSHSEELGRGSPARLADIVALTKV